MMQQLFFAFGSSFAALGVIAGAFGAHALKRHLTEDMLATFEIAVRYQLYHALGLIVVSWAASQWNSQLIVAGGYSWHIRFFQSLYPQLNGYTLVGRDYTDWWGCLHRWLAMPSVAGDTSLTDGITRSELISIEDSLEFW